MRHHIKKDRVNILVDKGRVSGSRKIQEFGLGWVMAGARKLVPRTPELSMRWGHREPRNVGLHWLWTGRAVRREKLGSAQNGSFRYQANWRKLGIHSTAELPVPDLADITGKLAHCENKSAKTVSHPFLILLGEWISEEFMEDVSVVQSSTSRVTKVY